MKVLIYGSRGWIASYVIEELKKLNVDYYCSQYYVDNEEAIEKELLEIKPTHMLSLIGRTHGKIGDKEYTTIDYLEQPGKLVDNVRDNLYSPIVLALLAEKHKIHYTYLGTGCIFNYDEEHLYGVEENGFIEESKPNFFGSSYSIVKGFTDRLMHRFKLLNLRIRMPITADLSPRNFISKITKYQKICSVPNSMSVLPDLIPIMIDMMKKMEVGTYNFTNPGLITHNEILEMYRDIVDKDFKWENFSMEEQDKILDSKRSNNYLDTSKLEEKYKVKNIKESIKDILIRIGQL
jgi:nucleoside-diphosphate-sugar epimerase